MFSFGLIIYFIETGSHYFKEKLLEKVELLKSDNELELGQEITDSNTLEILEGLLKKSVTERMKIATFKVIAVLIVPYQYLLAPRYNVLIIVSIIRTRTPSTFVD